MTDEGSNPNRRTKGTLRSHLVLTGGLATLSFALVITLSVFLPIAMQLGRTDLRSTEAYGLAQHFLFLHSALWPLVLLSLIASIVSANVLFRRMREPLVRFVRCYEALAGGSVPAQVTIRATDYLTDEADALNAMLDSLGRRQTVRREAVARLEEAIGDLASRNVPESVLSDLQEIAKQLSDSPQGGSRDVAAR